MIKRLLTFASLAVLCCCSTAPDPSADPVSDDPSQEVLPSEEPSVQPSEEPSEEPSETPRTPVLAAPGDLRLSENGDGILLQWTDNSVGEEGYMVEKTGKNVAMKRYTLPADSESWTDETVTSGDWTYSVKAFKGMQRGNAASVEYSRRDKPSVSVNLQHSCYMISLGVTIVSDGGGGCESGVCWSTSPSPSVDGDSWAYSKTLGSGDKYYANLRGLEQGRTYYLRVWIRTRDDISYAWEGTCALGKEPEAFTTDWTPIDSYGLPSSLGLYTASATVSSGKVNMWYAEADFSKGDLELRTLKGGSSLQTLTSFVTSSLKDEKVYVVTNGGYFYTPAGSYSYIVDRGEVLAKNIASLTREKSYYVARGAFGLDSDMKPSIYWLYNSSVAWAYDEPLPVYDGGPVERPTAIYPCKALEWEPYEAMGGGPVLVRDGRMCFDYLKTSEGKYLSNSELFQTDIYASGLKAPRTAVGYKADGRVVLFICDGRNSGGSAGLTLDELARVMKGLGCTDVLNLDGGGSTMMTVGNEATLLNVPSDGKQRAVYSYMAIVGK